MDEIKEIEERMEDGHWRQREDIKYLLSKIKELKEGIEEHKKATMEMLHYDRWKDGKWISGIADEELYKLIEEKP